MLQHYTASFIFTALALIGGFVLGGWQVASIILILGILEVSLSFDNAVVNASVLKNWSEKWRARFITWGIPIAVFGMRLVFPLLIVAIVAGLGPIDALSLAVSTPSEYERILTSVHHEIAAFGSAFLMLVFLNFFIDGGKDIHWLKLPEELLQKLAKYPLMPYYITIAALGICANQLEMAKQLEFVIAGIAGMMTYGVVHYISAVVGDDAGGTKIVREGVGGFLYLASFSFDGVIAAFALTNQIFVIMVGLAVGAFFVRSMTLHLVHNGTLAEFKYLESGAFWAIGALAVIMMVGSIVHVHELITGLIGATAIGAAIWCSIQHNKQQEAALTN
jgi:hypothetical protein